MQWQAKSSQDSGAAGAVGSGHGALVSLMRLLGALPGCCMSDVARRDKYRRS